MIPPADRLALRSDCSHLGRSAGQYPDGSRDATVGNRQHPAQLGTLAGSEASWASATPEIRRSCDGVALVMARGYQCSRQPRARARIQIRAVPLHGNLGGVRFWERNGSAQPRACVARCGQLDPAQYSGQGI
jgi:hypothetical protein